MATDLEATIVTGYGFEGAGITFGAAMLGEDALPNARCASRWR